MITLTGSKEQQQLKMTMESTALAPTSTCLKQLDPPLQGTAHLAEPRARFDSLTSQSAPQIPSSSSQTGLRGRKSIHRQKGMMGARGLPCILLHAALYSRSRCNFSARLQAQMHVHNAGSLAFQMCEKLEEDSAWQQLMMAMAWHHALPKFGFVGLAHSSCRVTDELVLNIELGGQVTM